MSFIGIRTLHYILGIRLLGDPLTSFPHSCFTHPCLARASDQRTIPLTDTHRPIVILHLETVRVNEMGHDQIVDVVRQGVSILGRRSTAALGDNGTPLLRRGAVA